MQISALSARLKSPGALLRGLSRAASLWVWLWAMPAHGEPPPFQAEIAGWAERAGYRLSPYRNCQLTEERHFGALGSVCWSAKARTARRGSARLFPRLEIVLSVYRSAAEAQGRMARFRDKPPGLSGEAPKAYPLRAGFRVEGWVITIKTDAAAFEPEVGRAAVELSRLVGGTQRTCWMACPDP